MSINIPKKLIFINLIDHLWSQHFFFQFTNLNYIKSSIRGIKYTWTNDSSILFF